MGSHQFLTLVACLLCFGLSTVAVNQLALDADPSSERVSETRPAPSPDAATHRL